MAVGQDCAVVEYDPCDCNGGDGVIVAQYDPAGTTNTALTTWFVLVDAAGNVIETSTTGTFTAQPTGNYSIFIVNFDSADAPTNSAVSTVTIPGSGPYATAADIEAAITGAGGTCADAAGPQAATVNDAATCPSPCPACTPSVYEICPCENPVPDTCGDLEIYLENFNQTAGYTQEVFVFDNTGAIIYQGPPGVVNACEAGSPYTVYAANYDAASAGLFAGITMETDLPAVGPGVCYELIQYGGTVAVNDPATCNCNPLACNSVLTVCDCITGTGDLQVNVENTNPDPLFADVVFYLDAAGNIQIGDGNGGFVGLPAGVYDFYTFNYDLADDPCVQGVLAGGPYADIAAIEAALQACGACYNMATTTIQGSINQPPCDCDCDRVLDVCECNGDAPELMLNAISYTSGNGYEQWYILVDQATGLIVMTNQTGIFSNLATGTYDIYAINTDDAAVIASVSGATGDYTTWVGTLPGGGCFALMGPEVGNVNTGPDCIPILDPIAADAVCTDPGIPYDLTAITPTLPTQGGGNGTITWYNDDGSGTAPDIAGGAVTSATAGGTYWAVYTDPDEPQPGNGVDDCTVMQPFVLTENANPTADAGGPYVIDCDAPNGQIVLDGTGSTAGVNYSWVASAGGNIVSGGTTANPTVDAAGTYTLTVTDPNTNCTDEVAVNVTLDANIPNVTVPNDIHVTCVSADQFPIVLNGGGDTGAGFTVGWTTADGNIVSGAATTNATVDQAGTYTFTITNDATNCTNSADIVITEDTTPPIAEAGPDQQISCQNPEATMDGSGSSAGAGFTYNWTVVSGTVIIVSGQGTTSITVQGTGVVMITVTDTNNGCTATDTAEITGDGGSIPIAEAGSPLVLNCINNLQGNLTGSGSGTPSWSGPGIIAGGNTFTPTVNQSGTYTLTVTSADGCVAMDQVEVVLDNAPPIANAGSQTPLDCLDGVGPAQVHLNGTASSSGVTYQWTTANGNIISGANTATPLVDLQGTYVLVVTDPNNGCTATADVEVVNGVPCMEVACDLTIESAILTNCDPETGTFYVELTASAVDGTDEFEVFLGTSVLGDKLGTFLYTETAILGPFPADGSGFTLFVSDDDNYPCFESINLTAPSDCGELACEITDVTANAGECNDNNTPTDPSDDFYTVTVTASAANGGSGFDVSVDGVVLLSLDYGSSGSITLPADNTSSTVTFTDNGDASCSATAEVGPVASCSDEVVGGPSCEDINLVADEFCVANEAGSDFNVLITITSDFGGPFNVISSAGLNATVDEIIPDGPFASGVNIEYTVSYTLSDGSVCQSSVLVTSPTCQGPTAINLVAFDGRTLEEGNLLNWSTASERDNDYFTLKRSFNGVDFETISTVNAVGNSTVTSNYEFLDESAPNGVSYYLLSQTDYTGQEDVNEKIVRLVRSSDFGIIAIRPIPAKDFVNIDFNVDVAQPVSIKVMDVLGRTIQEVTIDAVEGYNTKVLDIRAYTSG